VRTRFFNLWRSSHVMFVTLDTEGQLALTPDNQPAYRLAPQEGRRSRIVELEGFFVEFRGEGTIIDEVIFYQPNGTSSQSDVGGSADAKVG